MRALQIVNLGVLVRHAALVLPPGLLKMPDVSHASNVHEAQAALLGLVRRWAGTAAMAVRTRGAPGARAA